MAEALLANGASQRGAGERYQVIVHTDATALADDARDGCCQLDDGPALPPETARRLACDASLVAITERDGRPLSVGRKTRTVPAVDTPCAAQPRPRLSLPRLQPAPLRRRPPHPPLGAGWPDQAVQPAPAVRSSPPAGARGRLFGRGVEQRRHQVQASRRAGDTRGPAEPRRGPGRASETPPARRARAHSRRVRGPPAGDHFDYGRAVEGLLLRDGLLEAPPPPARARIESTGGPAEPPAVLLE